MTKKEFEQKFNTVYDIAFSKLANAETLKEKLKDFSDENGKISSEDCTVFALIESINFNREILKSVFEEILEFDE